jgi:transposase
MEPVLIHYGMPRRSGRYPWGSGENPYQRNGTFYSEARALHNKGVSDTDIAKMFGMSTTEYRKQYSLSKTSYKESQRALNEQLMEEGLNRSERARRLGVNESTVRSWENEASIKREKITSATVDVLKRNVDEKRFIDVGDGVASGMGITKNRLDTAVQEMVNEGYSLHNIKVEQVNNPGKFTTVAVLCEPGTTKAELYSHMHEIGLVNEKFLDSHGLTTRGMKEPKSISSKKVQVAYAEDGGSAKDGLIELRRGADGLDLGGANYAQVRIAVDGTHYLKGVAVYSDDLPKGIDIRFNTNKSNTGNKLDALKKMSDDAENPFGSTIKDQRGYLNIVNKQGDWQEWSKTLSSQFLSKQSVTLAKQQLAIAKQEREAELKDIMMLSNPTVRKHELMEFSEKCDTAAVHLKAASMPGQSNSLILPVNSLKPNEVYAKNYPNGTEVILVRHPHGGTFELPSLKVNNRNKEAQKLIGDSNDAVGIHHSVAAQLSGADFDGDTVIVIPNNSRKIQAKAPYKALQEFDPKIYKLPDDAPASKVIKPSTKQREMGVASNLITDMTLQKAPPSDIIRAVKYSMVVIDSEKHRLDYKQARKDYDINGLKKMYQQKPSDDGTEKYGGASTLISRAKSEIRVDERRQVVKIDPNTGEKIFYPTNRTYTTKSGEKVKAQEKSTQMREAKDAFKLVSSSNNGTGTAMERVYAKYANDMKSLGNQARKAAVNTKENSYSPEAAKTYAKEVSSLKTKLASAKAWSPKERSAQLFADHIYKMAKAENPAMTDDQKKKVKQQALVTGRARLNGTKPKVTFTDSEWKAVQSGAVSKTMLTQLLRYADSDEVRARAMPKKTTGLSSSKVATAKARLNAGYSYAEVSKMLGVSVSTLQRAVNE